MASNGFFATAPPFWENGPQPGSFYNFPNSKPSSQFSSHLSSKQVTLAPTVTGTSVLGLKFDKGIIIAADTLGSYGSLARFRDLPRVVKVNDRTVVAAAGDYADFQFLVSHLEQQVISEECLNDGFTPVPSSVFSWLTRVLYNRRTQGNPLWNVYVVGGMEEARPFLGYVDKLGVAYESNSVASGFGAYIAQPLLRDALEKKPSLSQKDAIQLIENCLKVLFYRDARSLNRYMYAVITAEGVKMVGPKSMETNWEVAHMVSGYE